MTTAALTEMDDEIFSSSSYNLPIPTMDGYKAATLELRFSGSGHLDRTSLDGVGLLEQRGTASRSG
jgi:hypothetical protein